MIPSLKALQAIHERRGDTLVVATMTGRSEWNSMSTSPAQDMAINSMGKASSFGLGLALAQPERKVIVLDGDGSLTMNLNTFVTIGGKRPANMIHIVLENGGFLHTGGEPIAGAGVSSFPEMAKGAGYVSSHEYDNLEAFVSDLDGIFEEKGPVFICLHVEHDPMPRVQMRSSAQTAYDMMELLANG